MRQQIICKYVSIWSEVLEGLMELGGIAFINPGAGVTVLIHSQSFTLCRFAVDSRIYRKLPTSVTTN